MGQSAKRCEPTRVILLALAPAGSAFPARFLAARASLASLAHQAETSRALLQAPPAAREDEVMEDGVAEAEGASREAARGAEEQGVLQAVAASQADPAGAAEEAVVETVQEDGADAAGRTRLLSEIVPAVLPTPSGHKCSLRRKTQRSMRGPSHSMVRSK